MHVCSYAYVSMARGDDVMAVRTNPSMMTCGVYDSAGGRLWRLECRRVDVDHRVAEDGCLLSAARVVA